MIYHVEFYKQNGNKTDLVPIPYNRSWITAIQKTFDLDSVIKKRSLGAIAYYTIGEYNGDTGIFTPVTDKIPMYFDAIKYYVNYYDKEDNLLNEDVVIRKIPKYGALSFMKQRAIKSCIYQECEYFKLGVMDDDYNKIHINIKYPIKNK